MTMDFFLLAAIAILQGLDIETTYRALTKGQGNYEANKLMAWLMGKLGMLPALLLTKAIMLIMLTGAILWAPSRLLTIVLGGIILLYAVVVINNFRRL